MSAASTVDSGEFSGYAGAPLAAGEAAAIRHHGLAPLAFYLGFQEFRDDFTAAALLAELRENDLVEAVAALADDDIPAVLLKGISYVGTIYPDPALRPMSDVDLMVPARDFARARRTLYRLGYWDAGSAVSRAPIHHAITLKRRGGCIDLHQRIIQPLRTRIDEAAMWRRARPAAERADGARRLAPVDEAILHMVHIARHELMVPAINYLDTALLAARLSPIEASQLSELMGKFRVSRACRAVRAMTDALLSPPRPPTATSRQPRVSRTFAPTPAEVLAARPVWRPLQIARKALFVDGPRELAGLAAIAIYERFGHRLWGEIRRTPTS